MNTRNDSFFVVVDGIDGAGKGETIKTAVDFFTQKRGRRWLDLDEYWLRNHRHPQTKEQHHKKDCKLADDYLNLEDIDIIKASEPTYTDIGNTIRNSIIRNKGEYSARFTAEMYAADRNVLYKQLLMPAIDAGKIWLQSRSFSTSIVYQRVQAEELKEKLTVEQILSFEGNQLAMKNPPNLIIIPIPKNVAQAMERTKKRDKDDKTFFEDLEFQLKLKPHYESTELKQFFEKLGTKVEYVDSGAELHDYKQQVWDVLDKHYKPKIRI